MSFIFRSSILETYSLQCLDLFQSIIKLLKAINRCKIKMFWSWYFLSFEVNFPPIITKIKHHVFQLFGRVLHHPTNISPMTTLSAIPYTVSKKGHMIWHVIVLNYNILIYSFILEILNFNDLFSLSIQKKSYLSALPPVCDIVDAERNGELCNYSWPMSPLTVIQYRTTCTD